MVPCHPLLPNYYLLTCTYALGLEIIRHISVNWWISEKLNHGNRREWTLKQTTAYLRVPSPIILLNLTDCYKLSDGIRKLLHEFSCHLVESINVINSLVKLEIRIITMHHLVSEIPNFQKRFH